MAKILICEDKAEAREALREILEEQGYDVLSAEDGRSGLEIFIAEQPDLIFLDIYMPVMDGLSALKEIMKLNPDQIVIMLTASKDIKQSVQAMKLGAHDYITKPFNLEELFIIIKNALKTDSLHKEVIELKKQLASRQTDIVIGDSKPIKNIIKLIDLVSPTGMSVLITGESGTGKEVFAQLIHRRSERSQYPFVAVDCGAIPENLIESELFGYEKGAFTGADKSRQGKFEAAHKGTLMLDEITNLSFDGQAKLLRALEERKIRHVGGDKDIAVDVRVLATTNLDLQEVLKGGKFRLDLYHRLNEFMIHLPSLRERREDIPELARYFLGTANLELGKKVETFTPQALEYICRHDWQGNVRELKHALKRAVLLCESREISLEDLVTNTAGNQFNTTQDIFNYTGSFSEVIAEIEKKLINQALDSCQGNKTTAAEQLGMNRKALYRKMKSLDLE
ncbi:MAG: sigma-54 dependent transcriptional regulator [Candidatus Cloacimonetes bacterium]|nr:sigma-54 dependent transcriptional regulator [Candidatus Cloacimonadota bacterium]